MEERFLRVETKLAYTENEVYDLNKVVYEQGLVIEQLRAELQHLKKLLGSQGFDGDLATSQLSPHDGTER